MRRTEVDWQHMSAGHPAFGGAGEYFESAAYRTFRQSWLGYLCGSRDVWLRASSPLLADSRPSPTDGGRQLTSTVRTPGMVTRRGRNRPTAVLDVCLWGVRRSLLRRCISRYRVGCLNWGKAGERQVPDGISPRTAGKHPRRASARPLALSITQRG